MTNAYHSQLIYVLGLSLLISVINNVMKTKKFTANEFLIVVALIGMVAAFVFRIYTSVETEDDVIYLIFVLLIVSLVYLLVWRIFGDNGIDWLNRLQSAFQLLLIVSGVVFIIYILFIAGPPVN